MKKMITKAKTGFQRSLLTKIYLREKEIAQIKFFLSNKESILHICGNPGTGKTSTVFFVLNNKKYTYINYLEDKNIQSGANILKRLKSTKQKILVIDEFDKLYQTNKNECLKLFDFVEQNNKKLITISNNLTFTSNVYLFEAYTPSEILTIVKTKINDEIGQQIAEDKLLDIIAKKYGNLGDIRKVFDYVKELINKKGQNDEILLLKDFVVKCDKKEDTNFHEQIIKKIIAEKATKNKLEAYKIYYTECNKLNIQALCRSDAYLLFELYQ